MDYRALGALFRRIILAGAPLLGSGCETHTCGFVEQDVTVPVNVVPTDAGRMDGGVADLVARCQASASDCNVLCLRQVPQAQAAQLRKCELVALDEGGVAVHVVYVPYCVGGRCPPGLAAPTAAAHASSPLGAWLAACAHLEAASIDAFDILATELGAHRAPRRLIAAARTAARDERRHARVIGRLAARHGSVPPRVRITRGAARDIESIALENAAEGCTRETYAALIAYRQARVAADPEIRAAMAGIARDETRHAALAWAVDAWANAQLGPAAHKRVREARRQAGERLLGETAVALPPPLLEQAGLPDAEEAGRLATALRAQLPS